ncbi:MAG TPA: hypothetical protein VG710_14145 [Opitutus sp.]|nr:hypothetical protein [Opitutus sp.]
MGQSKKRRSCPAVGPDITSVECGDHRQSRYSCPESCPFNPFAVDNYEALLRAEDELDGRTVKRLAEEIGGMDLSRAIDAAEGVSPGHGAHAATVWRLFFKRDDAGRTFAERWRDGGLPGLKNDERVFFLAKARMRVALMEVHRIIDDRRFEAVDLLEPDGATMLLVDRSLAAQTVRFSTFLTWLYPLPHFWRMSGTGIVLSDLGPFAPLEMLDECVAHLGGPAETEARGRWLAENFVRIEQALTAVGLERRRQMFAEMDAYFGAATYELRATFAACCAALAADRDIDVDELSAEERAQGFVRAMVWFEETSGPATPVPGRRVLGRILLKADEARVESLGGARLERLRERFESRLGERARFVKERRDNLGGRMAAEAPPVEIALVPPRLLERPTKWDLSSSRIAPPPAGVSLPDYQAALLDESRRGWIDNALPVLDGRTPRAAAGVPALRAQLVELVKGQVRQVDRQNLKTGRSDDINGLVRELGLGELDFPPPPPRAAPPEEDEDDFDPEEDLADADDLESPPDRPPAPRLIGEPLSLEQSMDAIDRVLDSLDTAQMGLDEIEASGSTLVDDMAALTEEWMNEDEFAVFISFLLQAWFALVPLGVAAPALDFGAMAAAMKRDEGRLQLLGSPTPENLEKFFGECRQPALLQALAANQLVGTEKLPKKRRPSPAAMVGMMLASKALLDELDRALRE